MLLNAWVTSGSSTLMWSPFKLSPSQRNGFGLLGPLHPSLSSPCPFPRFEASEKPLVYHSKKAPSSTLFDHVKDDAIHLDQSASITCKLRLVVVLTKTKEGKPLLTPPASGTPSDSKLFIGRDGKSTPTSLPLMFSRRLRKNISQGCPRLPSQCVLCQHWGVC
jgi:hypothetical protein